jgi:hypothetical protein
VWKQRVDQLGIRQLLGEPEPPPDFLVNLDKLAKPYGVKTGLHYSVHAGQSSADAGFALQSTFEWEGREFGLTTELDVIPLDRVKIVRPASLTGMRFEKGEGLPAAFVEAHFSRAFDEHEETGGMRPGRQLAFREGVKLTGESKMGYLQTTDGDYISRVGARIIEPRDSFPSLATGDRKWIDISIKHQTLVAYEGKAPVYATLVSTGRSGMADPEESDATVRGTFMIHSKSVSSTMDGDEDKSDSFNLRDVPFVQYFHKGYALHGTYWHDEFGKVRSHGCVNLAPTDAAWLFEWTDPVVPPTWHATLNKERGPAVYIHY